MKFKLIFALVLIGAILFSSASAFAAAGAVYTLTNSSSVNAVVAPQLEMEKAFPG